MKHFSQRFLSVALLALFACSNALVASDCGSCTVSNDNSSSCSSSSSCSDDSDSCNTSCRNCTTVLVGRSSHNNDAYFGWSPYFFIPDVCEFNHGFTLGYEYQQTFGKCNLAKCLVGTNKLAFQGSQVTNRKSDSLLADYFGLSQVFDGVLNINPEIKSNNLHFDWYLGFDNWVQGLYLEFQLTFSNQKRSLYGSPNNCNTDCGTTATTDTSATANPVQFPVGYMATGAVDSAKSIQEALSGDFLFGDMQTKWAFGRWSNCSRSVNKVAGFSINLGYNFWNCDDSHLGAYIRYTAPTGTNLNGKQKYGNEFFAPIVGNGHHNEVGGGLTLHKHLWSNDCGDAITLYISGYATHLFKTCQIRSFDFKDKGCMSRYMLLKQLNTAAAPANYAYAGANGLINAINLTTRNVESSFNVQGDASVRFIYKHDNFSVALGYNIFGRSQEKLCVKSGPVCNAVKADQIFGFKGCTGVAYYNYTTTGTAPNQTTSGTASAPVALNATQSGATSRLCGTVDGAATTYNGTSIVGVAWDNLYTGSETPANAVANTTPVSDLEIAFTSAPAVAITQDNLNALLDETSGKSPRIITNKGFVQLDYVWDECCWSPYLGVGAEVEAGSKSCDIRQWGVWARVGLGF